MHVFVFSRLITHIPLKAVQVNDGKYGFTALALRKFFPPRWFLAPNVIDWGIFTLKKNRWSAPESEIALLKLTSIAAMQNQLTCSFAYINLQCIAGELNVN